MNTMTVTKAKETIRRVEGFEVSFFDAKGKMLKGNRQLEFKLNEVRLSPANWTVRDWIRHRIPKAARQEIHANLLYNGKSPARTNATLRTIRNTYPPIYATVAQEAGKVQQEKRATRSAQAEVAARNKEAEMLKAKIRQLEARLEARNLREAEKVAREIAKKALEDAQSNIDSPHPDLRTSISKILEADEFDVYTLVTALVRRNDSLMKQNDSFAPKISGSHI